MGEFMNIDPETIDQSRIVVGRILNLGICIVIALLGTGFLLSLLGNPEKSDQENSKRENSFVFKAFACWVLSWWMWVVLWAFAVFFKGIPSEVTILSLSDCNTILLVLFYLGLTRGNTYELARYVIHGVMLFAIFIVIVLGLYFLGGDISTGRELHIKWSLALSMFSPLLVGWAIKLRYDTDWGLITGLTYAVSQPVAYEAIFGKALSDDKANAVLIVLALLKVMWTTTITYYIGFKPVTSDTLILPHRESSADSGLSRGWKILLLIQLIAGVVVTWLIAQHYQITILQGAVALLISGVFVFVGLITSIKTLASELHKWLNKP